MKRTDFINISSCIAAITAVSSAAFGQEQMAQSTSVLPSSQKVLVKTGQIPSLPPTILSIQQGRSGETVSPLKLPDQPHTPSTIPNELKAAEKVLEENVDDPRNLKSFGKGTGIPGKKKALAEAVQERKEAQTYLTEEKQGSPSRSLQETLEQAYMQNAILDAARADFRSKVETLSQANADWRPSLSVEANQNNQLRYPANGSAANNQYRWREYRSDYAAVVKQNFFKGGGTVAKIGEEESNVAATRYELGALEQQTLFDAIHAHTEVLAKEAILKNQLETQAFSKKRYDQAQAWYEVGQGSRGDAAYALAQYEETTANVAIALGELESSKAAYLYQVGTLPKSFRPASIILDIPKSSEEAQKIAQEKNPTIIAAKYALEAAEYNVNLQISSLLPSVDVSGNIGNDYRGGTDYPFPFNNRAQTNIGFNTHIKIPLYEQGIPNSKVRQAYQIVAKQKVNLVNVQRKVIKETNVAWATFIAAKESLKNFIAQIKSLELSVEGVVEEYKVGMKSIVDVFVERDKLTQAQNRLAFAQQKLVDSTYAVLQAMGRLTACDLRLRVNYYDPEVYYRNYKDAWIQFWQSEDMRYVKEVNPK